MSKPDRSCMIRLAQTQARLAVWVVFYGPRGGEVPA